MTIRAPATLAPGHLGVMREVGPGPDGELEAELEVEERNCTMLELGPNDPWDRKPEAVAVERECSGQIIDP